MQNLTIFSSVKNVIFERARFNHWKQLEGESAEQYIAVLYNLAENCEYGELKAKMIRDCLVVGIRNSTLSENLQYSTPLRVPMMSSTLPEYPWQKVGLL